MAAPVADNIVVGEIDMGGVGKVLHQRAPCIWQIPSIAISHEDNLLSPIPLPACKSSHEVR